MDLEGSIRVAVAWDGRRIRGVRIASTRPDVAPALLAGRRADDAPALLPRIFSICARAQAAASATALDAARGTRSRSARDREMDVLAEVALEYLWRVQIDVPRLLGLPQRTDALVRLKREVDRQGATMREWSRFVDALRTLIEQECAGMRFEHADAGMLAEWEAASAAPAARLLRALRALPPGSAGTALLPPVSDALLREIGAALQQDPAFSRHPRHADAPAECGARSRLAAHPLLRTVATSTGHGYQRILARWIELAAIPQRMTRLLDGERVSPCVHGVALSPGSGIAGVETARGLLVHAVELADERVARYRIVAPTEWNFHPQGALPADLVDVPAGGPREVERLAGLAVQSLDPCVRYTLEVEQPRA